jgi:hypothetical protein
MMPAGTEWAVSELTPKHVLVDLFDSDDFPVPIPDPEAAAEIVIQRLMDAGFEIKAQERCRTWSGGADRSGSTTASAWPATQGGWNGNDHGAGFGPALTPLGQTWNPPA